MKRLEIVSIALGLLLGATFAREARAADDREGILFPVEGGYMFSPLTKIGAKPLQAGTVSVGAGYHLERVSLLAFGRAGMGPDTALGWGGARGSLALLDRWGVAMGPELAVSAGAGRHLGAKTGLIASIEPGVYLRLESDAVGAFDLRATWQQPVYVQRDGYRGAVMFSLAWNPAFRWWF